MYQVIFKITDGVNDSVVTTTHDTIQSASSRIQEIHETFVTIGYDPRSDYQVELVEA